MLLFCVEIVHTNVYNCCLYYEERGVCGYYLRRVGVEQYESKECTLLSVL